MPTKVTRGKRPKKTDPKKVKEEIVIPFKEFETEYETKHQIKNSTDEVKFIQSNGLNQSVLKKLFDIQNNDMESGFTTNTTIVDDDLINAVDRNLHNLFSTDYYNDELENIEFSAIDSKSYHNSLNHSRSIEFQFNNQECEILEPNHIVHYPINESNMRIGVVFNTGGIPLTMEWCPLIIDGKKYLFISVVEKNSDISEFSNSRSSLTILEIGDNGKFEINKQILMKFVIKEIEFSFISNNGGYPATLLKLLLSNGTVEIWKIDRKFLSSSESNNFKFCKIKTGAKIFKIPNESLLITTSTFSSSNTLLVGTNYGYVGQFTINSNKLDYLISTRLNSIIGIKVAPSTEESDTSINGIISSTDFNNYIIKLPLPNKNKSSLINNFKVTIINSTNKELQSNKNLIYLNNSKAFLIAESPITIKKVSIDNPNFTTKFKISNDNEINCLGYQMKYNNGLLNNGFILLSGHSNGSIRLLNYLNLLFNTDKKPAGSSIRLLQMNKSKVNNNKFWLDLSYKVDKIGDFNISKSNNNNNSKQPTLGKNKEMRFVNDNEICTLKTTMMNENFASCWGNGLIVIEELII